MKSLKKRHGPAAPGVIFPAFRTLMVSVFLLLCTAAGSSILAAQDSGRPENDPIGPTATDGASAESEGAADDPFDTEAFDEAASGSGESGDDPFSSSGFRDAVAGSVASEEEATTEVLFGGTFAVQAQAAAAGAFEAVTGIGGISGKAFARVSVPDLGVLYGAWNLSHTFFSGIRGNASLLPVRPADPFNPRFSLSELHYSFDIGKRVFVRIGNQLISWGPSRIWTPVDFINLERADAFGTVDTRAGKPGLRLHLPFSAANAFAFFDFSGTVANGVVRDPVEYVNLGGRLDATLGDFELGLSGYGGMSSRAKLGFDATGRLLGITVYGEAAWAPGYSDYEQSFMGSAGFSRSFGELRNWSVAGEFFYNSAGDDYTGRTPPAGTPPLYRGRYYGYGELAAGKLLDDALTVRLSSLVNFSEMSWSFRLSNNVTVKGLPPFAATLVWNTGGTGKEFTGAAGDNSFSLSLAARIEF